MKLVCLLLSSLVAAVSSNQAIDEFVAGNRIFTARLYNEIQKANPGKSFIFSPFSAEVVLALTRVGAKGQTRNEFTTALSLPSPPATEEAFKKLLPKFKQVPQDLKLESANRLYLGKDLKILDSFNEVAKDVFNAEAENVDFSRPQEAASKINNWVERSTHDKIKNLIDPSSLDSLTRLVLVNALYFSGKWETQFNPHTTKEAFFLSDTNSKEVDMMSVESSFRYYDSAELKAQFIELPYTGGNVSMTIVLPHKGEGLPSIEKKLDKVFSTQPTEYRRVAVKVPKFTVETKIEMKPILKTLGLTTVFSKSADLSGISKEPLQVSDVVQKAFIKVTPEGTEAAAATAVSGILLSAQIPSEDPISFVADRPFLYYIKFNNILLLAGKISTL